MAALSIDKYRHPVLRPVAKEYKVVPKIYQTSFV